MDENKSSEPKKDETSSIDLDSAIDVKCPHCGFTKMKIVKRRMYLVVCLRCRYLVHIDEAMEEYDLSVIWGDDNDKS